MSDLKIGKVIWELRYPHAASIFDVRGELANHWQGRYELTDWKISQNQVIINNKSNSKYLQVNLTNFRFIWEFPENYDSFLDNAIPFTNEFFEKIPLSKINRVGLRIIQFNPRPHFKLLANNMRKRMYNLTKEDWDVFGGYPADVGFPLIFIVGEHKANFNIGPMEKKQFRRYFDSLDVENNLPQTLFFIDYDLFYNEPDWAVTDFPSKSCDFLREGLNIIQRKTEDIYNHFGGYR